MVFGDKRVQLWLLVSFALRRSARSMRRFSLTGARSIFALGRSFTPFAVLGRPGVGGRFPRNAILVQSAVTIGLLVFGAFSRDGFESMVEYTAPVFWTFMILVGVSLFVLRWRDPKRAIPFPVPLYPAEAAATKIDSQRLLEKKTRSSRKNAPLRRASLWRIFCDEYVIGLGEACEYWTVHRN